MKVDLREFRSAYLAEVDEHLAGIRQRLGRAEEALREGRSCARELRDVLRFVHTVKGLSAMVGVEPIVAIAHRLENVLRAAERAGGRLTGRELAVLEDGTAAIEHRVRAVADGSAVPPPPAALLSELDALESRSHAEPTRTATLLDPEIDARISASERAQLVSGIAAGKRALRVDFMPTPERAAAGLTITTVRERVGALAEIVRILPLSSPAGSGERGVVFALVLLADGDAAAIADAAGASPDRVVELLGTREDPEPLSTAAEADEPGGLDEPLQAVPDELAATGVLRVDVSRIDDALEKLSALIVTRSRLARAAASLAAAGVATRELDAILVDHARQVRDLRGSILRVRMVAMSEVLDRLPLLVRSLGRTTGKTVRLVIDGGEAELDKTVAERLFPALVHLLRNAVDHGLESTEERVAAGKPPAGTIRVSCATDASRSVEIRIRDDGRGIDRERVARKAGAPSPDDAALLDLICQPGFSTRDAVDTTSGRGVGMDVVKRIVDGLGGQLSVESERGAGTTFVLRVPLTISIVDAFTVRCGDQRFAIPVPVVEEIVELDPAQLVTSPRSGSRASRVLVRRGQSLPLFELRAALSGTSLPAEALASASFGHHAIVVRKDRRAAVAFAVDRVLGQQEAVVRPLADPLVSVAGISGSTDLGDGLATLVLDLVGLSSLLSEAA